MKFSDLKITFTAFVIVGIISVFGYFFTSNDAQTSVPNNCYNNAAEC